MPGTPLLDTLRRGRARGLSVATTVAALRRAAAYDPRAAGLCDAWDELRAVVHAENMAARARVIAAASDARAIELSTLGDRVWSQSRVREAASQLLRQGRPDPAPRQNEPPRPAATRRRKPPARKVQTGADFVRAARKAAATKAANGTTLRGPAAARARRSGSINLATWNPDLHPRIPGGVPGGGRFVGKVPDLAGEIKVSGGFTYDPRSHKLLRPGDPGLRGFAVAIPHTEKLLGGANMSRQDFRDAIAGLVADNPKAFGSGAKIGGWFSDDRGQYMVELSEVHDIPRDQAIKLGQDRNQEDMATGEFIDTGGTGG